MARPLSHRIWNDVLTKWPKQDLRPDIQFQDVFREAIEQRYKTYKPSSEADETAQARALQVLLQNKYRDVYKLKGSMLQPKSQPTYFDDLVREIEEAPKRTFFERLGKRLSGMIRMQ